MNTRMHAAAIPDADPKTLADPGAVASRIIDFIENETFESGTRLSGDWKGRGNR
jgi:hypothetical protein